MNWLMKHSGAGPVGFSLYSSTGLRVLGGLGFGVQGLGGSGNPSLGVGLGVLGTLKS